MVWDGIIYLQCGVYYCVNCHHIVFSCMMSHFMVVDFVHITCELFHCVVIFFIHCSFHNLPYNWNINLTGCPVLLSVHSEIISGGGVVWFSYVECVCSVLGGFYIQGRLLIIFPYLLIYWFCLWYITIAAGSWILDSQCDFLLHFCGDICVLFLYICFHIVTVASLCWIHWVEMFVSCRVCCFQDNIESYTYPIIGKYMLPFFSFVLVYGCAYDLGLVYVDNLGDSVSLMSWLCVLFSLLYL